MVNDGGIVLGERYEVLSKIGAGGMADVYKGRDTMLNRYVAIKVLKKEYRENKDFVRKFRSEAQAAAGLLNPNIVNVYDVGEDRGLYYMVMELVEGITLKEYIQKKGRLSTKEAISIAIQMCTGIEAAHKHNIIHRDIKPQNIIISKEGKVKVTDFGIARAVDSNTVSSSAMGSVHYVSPEQARGGYCDAKSDIYSVGITMYEMITGRVPFDGDSTVTVAMKHLQENITPPSQYAPDMSKALEKIILKCTQKSPERRYESTTLLIQDLKRALVDPSGSFVKIDRPYNLDETVMFTEEDMGRFKHGREEYGEYDDDEDDYDEDRVERNLRWLASRPPLLPAPEREAPEAQPGEQTVSVRQSSSSYDGLLVYTGTFDALTPEEDTPVYAVLDGVCYEACPTDSGFQLLAPSCTGLSQLIHTAGTFQSLPATLE